jgi:parvulin-like peptidyl-prolyl isomerase
MHPPLRPKLILLVALALVLTAGLTACGSTSSAKPAGSDIAVVGGVHVSQQDFNELLTQARTSFKQQGQKFPTVGSTAYETLKSQAIGVLVGAAERQQAAAKLGVTVTSAQVQARLDQIKKQYFAGSESKYQAQLKTQGLTDNLVHFDIRAQLVSEAVQAKLTKGLNVSAADVKTYYTQHLSSYTQPESRDVRHVLVKNKALADTLYAQLKGGADKVWCAIAKKYSQDPSSKNNCGKLTVTKGQTVAEFDKVAFSEATKTVHAPVHNAQYGWFIIEPLSNVKPSTTQPESKVASAIKTTLLQQKTNSAMVAWNDQVTKSFCSGSKVSYQAGYTPSPDPCATVTNQTTT